jgi:flagellar biosynthesis protein FlhF
MHIKRYEAATLEEALAQIKAELGPDALVLSTRRVRRDGGLFGWLGKPVVEVVAALDRELYEPRRSLLARYAGPDDSCRSPLARYAGMKDGDPAGGAVEPPRAGDQRWRELSLTSALLEPIEAELRALRRSFDGFQPASGDALRDEMLELRRSVERLGARGAGRKDGVTDRLLAVGFGALPAKALAAAAREYAEEAGSDPRAALVDVLARRLDPRLAPPRDDTPEPITLFVGACGVGKTTTVAKLAGRAAPGTGIVTTDVHRAGGAEPLRALAAAHAIPIATATSTDDALARIDALAARRVLVDTSGSGRADPVAQAELVRLRAALGKRARVHLVVSATTKEEDVRAELRRFASLAPDALIVAKSDDTESLASLGNLLLDASTPPLIWLGTGRRVPEDLAVPEPRALAARMLGAAA